MLDLSDTITALATASGPAALALIRVSGRRALFISDQVFRGGSALEHAAGHTLAVGCAVDAAGGALDQVVVAVYRAPRSYTGEDATEFICHGGESVSSAILSALVAAGARLAEPGEFTRRAFLNGKLDLAQAESVLDVIQAQTGRARESALARLQGDLSRSIQAMGLRAREILLDCEAFLDFQDQLPEDFQWQARAEQAAALAGEVDALVATAAAGRRLCEGARVVLAGRPNVGKSSLLNALLGEARALVSEQPGTTRDVLRESLDVGGVPVTLVDMAGLRGGSDDTLERAGIERARRELGAADAVILVLDASEPLRAEDRELLEVTAARRGLVALNKSDLPAAEPGSRVEAACASGSVSSEEPRRLLRVSARTGAGIPELSAELCRVLMGDAEREPALVGSVRQHAALKTAAAALAAAAERLSTREHLDTAAFELRESLAAFDEALGLGASEDVLNDIFRRFCVGK